MKKDSVQERLLLVLERHFEISFKRHQKPISTGLMGNYFGGERIWGSLFAILMIQRYLAVFASHKLSEVIIASFLE